MSTANVNVGMANDRMSFAEVDKIKHDAMVLDVQVREDTARAESAEKDAKAKPAPGKSEVGLAIDLGIEALAPGLKMASSAIELGVARAEDKSFNPASKSTAGIVSPSARHIDDDIASVNRAPGLYRDVPKAPAVNEGPAVATATAATTSTRSARAAKPISEGEDVMTRASLAASSLHDQPAGATKTWDVPKMEKTASLAKAKELTMSYGIANEQALNSAMAVTPKLYGMQQTALQQAPGMNMGMNGPSIRPHELLSDAKREDSPRGPDDGTWANRTGRA